MLNFHHPQSLFKRERERWREGGTTKRSLEVKSRQKSEKREGVRTSPSRWLWKVPRVEWRRREEDIGPQTFHRHAHAECLWIRPRGRQHSVALVMPWVPYHQTGCSRSQSAHQCKRAVIGGPRRCPDISLPLSRDVVVSCVISRENMNFITACRVVEGGFWLRKLCACVRACMRVGLSVPGSSGLSKFSVRQNLVACSSQAIIYYWDKCRFVLPLTNIDSRSRTVW